MTPENPLEMALVAATTDPDARPTFYRLVLDSPLYIIDDSPDRAAVDGLHQIEAGEHLHIATLDIDGVQHTPIFTSITALRAVLDSERRYVSLNGRALLEIVQESHLILNPGSQYGKQFLPEETAALLSGDIFRDHSTITITEPTKVLLGQPAQYPSHLTEALAELFRSLPDVKAAYLAQCVFVGSEEVPHTLIGIDASCEWSALVEKAVRTIRRAAAKGEIVDVVKIDDSDMSQYMTNDTKPFYRRKRFGLF